MQQLFSIIYTTVSSTIISDGCFPSYEYTGKVNVTIERGLPCLPWNTTTNYEFPDGSVTNAANYCRDPTHHGYLWCFTKFGRELCDGDLLCSKLANYSI